MLVNRIIPCLDVANNRVVKGVQFQNLRDAGCPVAQATRYEAEGADEIVVLDVTATSERRVAAVETVRSLRAALSIPLTVGGGVRDCAAVTALLAAGADKVAINTAAVRDPSLITTMANRFGRQCTVVAIDAAATPAGDWQIRTHAGTTAERIEAIEWAREAAQCGAGELLVTSWDRDGTQQGFDCALVRAVCGEVDVPVIASGGAADANDFVFAAEAGATGLLAASIFHDQRISIGHVKDVLNENGLAVRR